MAKPPVQQVQFNDDMVKVLYGKRVANDVKKNGINSRYMDQLFKKTIANDLKKKGVNSKYFPMLAKSGIVSNTPKDDVHTQMPIIQEVPIYDANGNIDPNAPKQYQHVYDYSRYIPSKAETIVTGVAAPIVSTGISTLGNLAALKDGAMAAALASYKSADPDSRLGRFGYSPAVDMSTKLAAGLIGARSAGKKLLGDSTANVIDKAVSNFKTDNTLRRNMKMQGDMHPTGLFWQNQWHTPQLSGNNK